MHFLYVRWQAAPGRGIVVVSDPYVIGVDIAGCSTVLQKKCDTGWKTSCTEAVYSIYSGNLLGADPGNVVFAE